MHDHLDEPLPTHQHRYDGLDELPLLIVHRRREGVFLLLAGLFLGTLAMLNILGITRFIVFASWSESGGLSWGQWGDISFAVAAGVLPYPLTFLCTDFISELYGRRRANLVVWIGLVLNIWVIFILWFAGVLPMQPEMVSYGTNALGVDVAAPRSRPRSTTSRACSPDSARTDFLSDPAARLRCRGRVDDRVPDRPVR
ncbi:MAG: VUT family protein [Phycisphaerales bacterium]